MLIIVLNAKLIVKGDKIVNKYYQSISDKIMQSRIKAWKRIGVFLVKEVRKRTPVKTGKLRRDISYKLSKETLTIFARLFYSEYVEGGTRFMKGHHMFKTVYDEYNTKINDMLFETMSRELIKS